MDTQYPEHEKLTKVKDESQSIGEFLEWLNPQGFAIAQWNGHTEQWDCGTRHEWLLAKYFGIDTDKLEQEKRQMLAEIRASN